MATRALVTQRPTQASDGQKTWLNAFLLLSLYWLRTG